MSNACALSASLNNAVWCDAVCRAAGGSTEFANEIWFNAVPSPPYFPNLITIDPRAEIGAVEDAVRKLPTKGAKVGVKDSFCALDLAPVGFSKLFEASWIWRDPVPPRNGAPLLVWTKIDSSAGLRAWEEQWWPERPASTPRPAVFGPTLLECDNISFLAGHRGTQLVAGAAITETEDVVGLTCTFFHGPDPMRQRRELLSVLESRYAGRAILGYQSGAELLAMRDLGFRDVGPLCVWLSTGSPSDGLATIDCVRPSPAWPTTLATPMPGLSSSTQRPAAADAVTRMPGASSPELGCASYGAWIDRLPYDPQRHGAAQLLLQTAGG
jgi:hypothetical protein